MSEQSAWSILVSGAHAGEPRMYLHLDTKPELEKLAKAGFVDFIDLGDKIVAWLAPEGEREAFPLIERQVIAEMADRDPVMHALRQVALPTIEMEIAGRRHSFVYEPMELLPRTFSPPIYPIEGLLEYAARPNFEPLIGRDFLAEWREENERGLGIKDDDTLWERFSAWVLRDMVRTRELLYYLAGNLVMAVVWAIFG